MLFSQDIAIDLGTSKTRVYAYKKGIILSEPSVAAMDLRDDPPSVAAIGKDAADMLGRTPGSVQVKRPLSHGVIADYEMTADMLKLLIRKAVGRSLFNRSRVILCIPSGLTEVERRAFHDAARNAGAKEVSIINSSFAAAIGAELPVSKPQGCMVANLGAGTCECSVIASGDVISGESVRIGGDDMDEDIIAFLRRKYNLLIGSKTSETVKKNIGSALAYFGEKTMTVRGRGLDTGLPKSVEVSPEEIRGAILDKVNRISYMICDALEKTPPELAADIMDNGIVLTGGVANLKCFDRYLTKLTKIKVRTAKDADKAVINGAGLILDMKAADRK